MTSFAHLDGSNAFAEYEDLVAHTRKYPDSIPIVYPALGLCGEAGEVAEKVKKAIRDHGGTGHLLTGDARIGFLKELGDVLWYVTAIAMDLGASLDEVAALNREKLLDRLDRNAINGEGDDR